MIMKIGTQLLRKHSRPLQNKIRVYVAKHNHPIHPGGVQFPPWVNWDKWCTTTTQAAHPFR